MRTNRAEMVLHPVRLEIIGVIGSRSLTPKQIAEALPDVPQATLYRQIKILQQAGVLEVVSQRQAHGAIESTFALKRGSARFDREEFAAFTPEEHKAYLAILSGRASKALARYVEQPEYDTTEEGMTYFGAGLALNDEEARQFRLDLLDLVSRYSKEPTENERLRLLTVSFIPEPKQ